MWSKRPPLSFLACGAARVPLNPCQHFVGLSHKAQGKQGLVNVHKIQTSLCNAFAAWLQWNEEAVVSLSFSPLSLLFYKQKLHYQTICLVIMKAVGASLIWCGTAKLLNALCWQGPIQMWQRAQSSSSHTHTDAYTLVKGGTGKATKKNFKHLSCAFSVMNNVLIEIA